MSEHIDPTTDLADMPFDDAADVAPAVEDAGWSPVMSVPPPDLGLDAPVDVPDAPAVADVPLEPPMPPVTGDTDLAPPPPDVGPAIELGEAPPLPPGIGDELPPEVPEDLVGEAPAAPAPPAGDDGPVDLGEPPMPPVTGDTSTAPPPPGETGETGYGEAPGTVGTGPIDLGEPPMPPVTGDADTAPPPAGGTDGGPIDLPTPPGGDPGAGDADGNGSGVSDIVGIGQPTNGNDPVPETPAIDVEDPGPIGPRTSEAVVDELYIRADTELAPVVVDSLVDDLQRTFPDLPASAIDAYRAAVAEGLTDGGLTWDEHKSAMALAGLGQTALPAGAGDAVASALTDATQRGDVVSTVVNIGNGPESFRLAVDGDSVQFESTRSSAGNFTVDRASFARAFDAPGAQVIARSAELAAPVEVPLDAPALPDLSGLDKDTADGGGSDFGRNLLIGGAVLLPAAGAATWYATKKVR